MPGKLFEWFKDRWLKPKSALIALPLLCYLFFQLISLLDRLSCVTLTRQSCYLIATPFVAAWIIYFVVCLISNSLPKAKRDSLAVLFVIDAESKQLFEAAKFKLINDFRSLISSSQSTAKINTFYLSRERVSKINLTDNSEAVQLLIRTNCMFLVSVRYSADDVNNAEHFELRINYGVRHPQFSKTAESLLYHDLTALKTSVGKQRFEKAQLISVFDFTAQTLALACQYILGFVYLLSGDNHQAYNLLSSVYITISGAEFRTKEYETLKNLTEDRLFATLANIAVSHQRLFSRNKDLQHLRDMSKILIEANNIRPDTYFYNLNMAHAYIVLTQDAQSAKECINKCKQSKTQQEWRYSEAFLCAYSGQAPGIIISKYREALKVPYEDLVGIVDYIEFVIEHEPQKTELHLAAGLIYKAIGDTVLMKQHLLLFLEKSHPLESRITATIREMLSVPCLVDCNNNCTDCDAQMVM